MNPYRAVEISKAFSGVSVLEDVDFAIRPGEIHALVGENGSGKSTLIKLLGGVHRPTAGHVEAGGEVLTPHSPAIAQAHGLAIVHQHYNLFPDLDIATNLGVGCRLPTTRWARMLDRGEMRSGAGRILQRLRLDLSPRMLVRDVGLAERKLLEIGRALLADASFLILDEPTALLDLADSARVLAIMRQLREEGVGIAFVSHRLDEVLAVADHVSVLRDGRLTAAFPRETATSQRLVENIVGPKQPRRGSPSARVLGEDVMSVNHVRLLASSKPVSLAVRRGEILGLTGLVGSGPFELARMLGGRVPLEGTLVIDGRAHRIGTPAAAAKAGIGYVPEDRAGFGIVEDMSVAFNLNMASLANVSPGGILRTKRMNAKALELERSLGIRGTHSLKAEVRTLSGGNQQKVQLGKWLASNPAILVIEAPTHGVDVGAKADIEHLLRSYAAGGGAVIVASTDVAEVLAMCDQVLVFNRGEIVAERDASAADQQSEILLSGAHSEQVTDIERLLEK